MPKLAVNKKAKFDYEILETFEAGLVLKGHEVKSAKLGQISIKAAYVTINKDNEPFLINAAIPLYKMAGKQPDYDPERSRKLLLNKKEIDYLRGKLETKGLTLVPISVYTKGNKIKIEFALGRGKKKHDKRETIKKREQDRSLQRLMRQKQ